ncbi:MULTISPECIES: macro domain-containing protein [unclassified Adlercreutzia]|uniref:macro domain-containing protein n=1 Tax=unclassified Adlercreutzia TaxID=2636013 RepID=UPI0013EB2E0B|nr:MULTISPECIES: macro domain-containing protein [unclassified Adlercreutzia]
MPCYIVRNDLCRMRVDVVVCPANAALRIGGGAGEAVARVAGLAQLQAACDAIGPCAVGDAVATPAFDFPAHSIVHAVGPVWRGGTHDEDAQLASCVTRSLALAAEQGAATVALPLISAGSYGFPPRRAFDVTIRAIRRFLEDHDLHVYLVLFDRESVAAGSELLGSVAEYVDDVYVREHILEGTRILGSAPWRGGSRGFSAVELAEEVELAGEPAAAPCMPSAPAPQPATSDMPLNPLVAAFETGSFDTASFDASDLRERIAALDESFAATVLRLIDERGLTDVQVYKRANMSRQLFAKIRKDDNYRPAKRTACALAIALELSLAEARDLLGRAGFALSHSSKADVIVEYFLIHGIYDIFQVNEALYAFDQPLLG